MAFTKIDTRLPGVFVLEPRVFGDNRGWFMETWSERDMEEVGLPVRFVQDNHSYTARKGTLRGIHFQQDPMSQAKLVRVVHGAVVDVAVDFRRGSPTFGRWTCAEISAGNKRQLFIPRGFGHAFLTLTDDVEFVYKCDNPYSRECDRSIRFDDPFLGIDWASLGLEGEPILSEKDARAPLFKDADCNFCF